MRKIKITHPVTNEPCYFFIRPNSSDEKVIKEIFINKFYGTDFNKEETWLDLGANIGVFAVFAAKMAKKVYSYECEEENYNILVQNVMLNKLKNVVTEKKAVVRSNYEGNKIKFYVNLVASAYWKHSLKPHFKNKEKMREVLVDCQHFQDLPKADCMKIDIEGGEIPILDNDTFGPYKKVLMEYDFEKDRSIQNYLDRMAKLEQTHVVKYGKFDTAKTDYFEWFPTGVPVKAKVKHG